MTAPRPGTSARQGQVVVQQGNGGFSVYNASGAPVHIVVDLAGGERY